MQKRAFSPWKWQDERSYVQAVEVKNSEGTLYCSGQAAIDADGISSNEDMKSQLQQAIANLEEVITTSTEELWPNFPILQEWVAKHNIKQTLTMLEVTGLFETLKVELEATVVK